MPNAVIDRLEYVVVELVAGRASCCAEYDLRFGIGGSGPRGFDTSYPPLLLLLLLQVLVLLLLFLPRHLLLMFLLDTPQLMRDDCKDTPSHHHHHYHLPIPSTTSTTRTLFLPLPIPQ